MVSYAKTPEPIQMPFALWILDGPKNVCYMEVHMIEPSMSGGDAAFCQFTLTACFWLCKSLFIMQMSEISTEMFVLWTRFESAYWLSTGLNLWKASTLTIVLSMSLVSSNVFRGRKESTFATFHRNESVTKSCSTFLLGEVWRISTNSSMFYASIRTI